MEAAQELEKRASGTLTSLGDEDRALPGDYNRGEPGARDKRLWSETG